MSLPRGVEGGFRTRRRTVGRVSIKVREEEMVGSVIFCGRILKKTRSHIGLASIIGIAKMNW